MKSRNDPTFGDPDRERDHPIFRSHAVHASRSTPKRAHTCYVHPPHAASRSPPRAAPPVNNAFEVVLASDDGSRLRRWLRSIVRWTSFGPLAKASELLRMIRSSPAEQLEAPLPGGGEASACEQMQQHGRVRPCSTAPSRRQRGIADRVCAPLHFPSRSEGDRRPGCAPLAISPNTNKS